MCIRKAFRQEAQASLFDCHLFPQYFRLDDERACDLHVVRIVRRATESHGGVVVFLRFLRVPRAQVKNIQGSQQMRDE